MYKTKLTVMAIIFALTSQQPMAKEKIDCLENALTQEVMHLCKGLDYKTADAELNRVYKAIKKDYADEKLFLKKLKKAQRLWIQLRDADFEMQFPHQKENGYYGSVFPTCVNGYKTQLTLQRVAFLKEWLIGGVEGETCNGSKKIQDEEEENKICYANVDVFKDNPKVKDVVELSLIIEGDKVSGEYNYLPFEKDQRLGNIKGTITDTIIKANYTFEQEGEKDNVNITIELADKMAIVEGGKKAKELGVLEKIKEVKCKI